jgi:hypothetical protein
MEYLAVMEKSVMEKSGQEIDVSSRMLTRHFIKTLGASHFPIV